MSSEIPFPAPRRCRLAASSLAFLALAVACEKVSPCCIDETWQRFDLWQAEARVAGEGRPLVRGVTYLGPSEIRPAAVLARQKVRLVEHLAAGEIPALRQAPGTRASWKVTLGDSSYLSFVPLAEGGRPCACLQRVEVRQEGGDPVEVYRSGEGEPRAAEPFAPATVTLDLGGFDGREVEITFAVEPRPGKGERKGRALWGSPALYWLNSERPEEAEARELRRKGNPKGHPNVLLIGIDTLRADALGAYGRSPSVTPALDSLASESDVWLDAFSCFNVTNPSFASLLTGLYGKDHGVYDFNTPLPAGRKTLAEAYREAGYDTRAILSIDHLRNAQSGLGQGFDEFTEAREQRAGEAAVDLGVDWIGERRKPFFLWLHLFDPHTPHTPPEPYASGQALAATRGLWPPGAPEGRDWKPFRPPGPIAYRNAVLGGASELYAGEVAYTDRQIDRLLGFLRSRGLLASTIVAVIADHGENLEDHGVSYRHSGLWDTTTHVPLMIRWPGEARKGRRLRGLVQNVDVFPTLLKASGLPVPAQDGLDLRRSGERGSAGRRAVFAEHTGRLGAMVRTERYKYMTSRGNRLVPDGAYLYDLEKDPGELRNLAGQGLAAERDLDALLRRWLAARRAPLPGAGAARLSPEEEARLRALGYL